MSIGQTNVVGASSGYVSNEAPECAVSSDYSVWQRYGLENTHFYDVMSLPSLKLYARIHARGVAFRKDKQLAELIDGRELWLMLFDSDFHVVKEMKLPGCRYSLFTGWCALSDGILLFGSPEKVCG